MKGRKTGSIMSRERELNEDKNYTTVNGECGEARVIEKEFWRGVGCGNVQQDANTAQLNHSAVPL